MFGKKILIIIAALLPLFLFAQEDAIEKEDKTLSPYFYVDSEDAGVDALPLLSTTADVKILGVIADVTVKQVYKNNGKKPLEAVYTFPASTRAAVYAMTMKIGKRIIKAEVQTRKQARETYEQAKQEGRSASLLEEQRPNVFQMNVANILPGDTITVELKYTELLIPEDGVYEFVYPTVVGPRYSNKSKENVAAEDEFVETPYTHEGDKSFYDFDIDVTINAGMPLSEVYSLSHKVAVDYSGNNKMKALINLESGQKKSGNKDFVLRYSLAGDRINTGLLLSRGEKENFFLLMLQPPKKVKKEDVPPREYIFVLDVSGSMNGFPLDISKDMIKRLLGSLRENDLFNVLLFAGSSRFLSCMSQPATEENIENALRLISKERGGGGTELLPALRKVYNNPKASGYSRSIVILTDGYIDVEEETFDLIAENLNKANVFSFGIGSGVNRYLIEGMARVGDGQPFFVLDRKNSEPVVGKFLKYIESPVLTDVNVEFNGFNAYDVEPRHIADVMEQRPIIVYGKWSGLPQGKIVVRGTMADDTELHVDIPVSVFAGEESNDAIKYIWARNKIALLSDYNSVKQDSNRVKEVTSLGLKYNLLTKYTSFVAVDYEIRNDGKAIAKVKQPLPLPEGVSDYAVGSGQMGTMYVRGASGAAMPFFSGKYKVGANTVGITVDGYDVQETKDEREINIPETVDFRDVVKYPGKALSEDRSGKVVVWVLYERVNDAISKCIYVKPSGEVNSVLYTAAKEALLKTTKANRGANAAYIWEKIEIEFNATGHSAKIVRILEVKNILYKPHISYLHIGDNPKIAKGNKVTVRYSVFTDECEKIEFNKVQTFVVGKDNINPALELLLKEMGKGGSLKADVPKELYEPEAKSDEYGYYDYNVSVEVLDVK
jgi:Ca-activated chloride channel family protein